MISYNDFVESFSVPRTGRYIVACKGDLSRAQKLYIANIRLSQSLHPLISTLEVILRNRLNTVLTNHFNDSNWILNQRYGFMAKELLVHRTRRSSKSNFLKLEVDKAINKLKRFNISVNSDRIIAEQNFSFWTELFDIDYYRALKGAPIQAFKILAPEKGRREVRDDLNKIRLLRNRINHNEPICFKGDEINLEETVSIYDAIINVLKGLSPRLTSFTREIDNFESVVYEFKNL